MRTLLLIATLTFTMSSVFAGATGSNCGDIADGIYESDTTGAGAGAVKEVKGA